MNDGRVRTRAEVYRNRGRRLDAQQRLRKVAEKRTIPASHRTEIPAKPDLRAFGRRLDQIETCYRQHTPPQVALADEMVACGGYTIPWADLAS